MSGPRSRHLYRRGAIYAVRFRVPADMVKRLGCNELARSIGTPDPTLARRRSVAAATWFRQIMEEFRLIPEVSRGDLHEAADAFLAKLLRDDDVPRAFNPEHEDEEVALNVELSRTAIGDLQGQLRDKAFGEPVQRAAMRIARKAGADFALLDVELQRYTLRLAAQAYVERLSASVQSLLEPEKDFEPSLLKQTSGAKPPVIVDPVHALERPQDAPRTLASMVATYLGFRRREEISTSHHDEMKRALDWMLEALGRDAPIHTVSSEDVRKVRDGYQRLDKRWRGIGRPFLQRQTEDQKHWIAPQTSSRYWHTVQAFFQWLRDERYLEDDPAAGIRTPRRANRPPATPEAFTNAEVEALLKTPLFAGRANGRSLLKPGSHIERNSYWWATMLGLHTGMRAGEMSQLEVGDFDFAAQPAVIHVRRENEQGEVTKSLKNPASIRDVPISTVLLQLGLAKFVRSRARAVGTRRVFPDIALGTKGKGEQRNDALLRSLPSRNRTLENRPCHTRISTHTDCEPEITVGAG